MPRHLWIALLAGTARAGVGDVHATAFPVWANFSQPSKELIMRAEASETESRLRQAIGQLQQGQPDYDQMEPALRVAVRQQMDATASMLRALGAVQSITYEGRQQNADVYDVRFANGEAVWLIALSAEGRISTLFVNRPMFTQTATEDRLRDVIGQLRQGQ